MNKLPIRLIGLGVYLVLVVAFIWAVLPAMNEYNSTCTKYTIQSTNGNNLSIHRVDNFKIDDQWVVVEDKIYPIDKLYNIERSNCDG